MKKTLALIALTTALQSWATPTQVLIPGQLRDSQGGPVTGSHDVQVSFYDASTGGTLLWSSSVLTVTASASGHILVPLDVTAGSPTLNKKLNESSASLYAEITYDVGTASNATLDTPIVATPRFPVSGQLFTVHARSTDSLREQSVSANAPLNGQLLTWAQGSSQWQPIPPGNGSSALETSAARKSTAAMSLYVRTDGDDSTCNGTANASSASAPACAFLTPQKAFDALPEVILHPVTVNVASGTYRFSNANDIGLKVSKSVGPSGKIVLSGSSTVFSGATSGAPTTPVGSYGIQILYPTRNFWVSGVSLQYFTQSGYLITRGTDTTLQGVSASYNQFAGLHITGGKVTLSGSSSQFSNNSDSGIINAGLLFLNGITVSALTNTTYGVQNAHSGMIDSLNAPLLIANSNTTGIFNEGILKGSVRLQANSNNYWGLLNWGGGVIDISGTLTASSNTSLGVEASNSFMSLGGAATVQNNGNMHLRSVQGAHILIKNALTVSGGAAWGTSLGADWKGGFYLLNNSPNNVSITGTGSQWQGLFAGNSSLVYSKGTGSITLSTFQFWGIISWDDSAVVDQGSGSRSVSGAGAGTAWVDEMALYRRGNFAAGTCGSSVTRCN